MKSMLHQNPEAPSWGQVIGQIALAGGANVVGSAVG
jgi:NADPH-dependent curcumin reductase CurA